MPRIEKNVELDIMAMCDECGASLSAEADSDGDLMVKPCENCIDLAKETSYNDGYEDGKEAGKEEASDD